VIFAAESCALAQGVLETKRVTRHAPAAATEIIQHIVGVLIIEAPGRCS